MNRKQQNSSREILTVFYEKDGKGGYILSFPDLPGVTSRVATLAEVRPKAERILRRYRQNLKTLNLDDSEITLEIRRKPTTKKAA